MDLQYALMGFAVVFSLAIIFVLRQFKILKASVLDLAKRVSTAPSRPTFQPHHPPFQPSVVVVEEQEPENTAKAAEACKPRGPSRSTPTVTEIEEVEEEAEEVQAVPAPKKRSVGKSASAQ